MDKKGQGDNYYNRQYNLNPRVRELLKQRLGNKDMSYMQAENVVISVMEAKYKKTLKELTDKDKEKLMSLFKENFTSNLPKKNIDVVVSFLNDNFDEEGIKEYIDHALTKYKPGMIYKGIRISNRAIVDFLEAVNIYPLMKGVIINKKYMNDLVPFFAREVEDFEYDKETLMVEKDYTNEMIEVFNDIAVDTDIRFHNGEEIFILATFDDAVAKSMVESFEGLVVESIPLHMFEWDTNGTPYQGVVDETELEELKVGDVIVDSSPPNIPKYTVLSSDKPTDVLINGGGYGQGINIYTDYYSVSIFDNGKQIRDNFETDGGIDICELKQQKSKLKEILSDVEVDSDDEELNFGVEFSILRNFIGKIYLTSEIWEYDKNIKYDYSNPTKKIPIDISLITGDLDDESRKNEKVTGNSSRIVVNVIIEGEYDKEEPLTMNIFNSL